MSLLDYLISNKAAFDAALAANDKEIERNILDLISEINGFQLALNSFLMENKEGIVENLEIPFLQKLELIIQLYLMVYINRYNYLGVQNFIESRQNWERDYQNKNEDEIYSILDKSLAELSYAASALYKAKITNKETSELILKPLFNLVGILKIKT